VTSRVVLKSIISVKAEPRTSVEGLRARSRKPACLESGTDLAKEHYEQLPLPTRLAGSPRASRFDTLAGKLFRLHCSSRTSSACSPGRRHGRDCCHLAVIGVNASSRIVLAKCLPLGRKANRNDADKARRARIRPKASAAKNTRAAVQCPWCAEWPGRNGVKAVFEPLSLVVQIAAISSARDQPPPGCPTPRVLPFGSDCDQTLVEQLR